MARIKIGLPEKFIFSTDIKVRIGDVNYGGHVGNDSILSIAHSARLEFLHSYNYSEMNVEGVSLIMADSAIIYKGESFFGDVLTVEIAATDFSKAGFDLVYKISNKKIKKDIAYIKTGMVSFDYKKRKITALPEKVFTQFSN